MRLFHHQEEKKETPHKAFENIVEFYLADNRTTQRGRTAQLEVRFGTHPKSGKPCPKSTMIMSFNNFIAQDSRRKTRMALPC